VLAPLGVDVAKLAADGVVNSAPWPDR
jgi:hypothetical protein